MTFVRQTLDITLVIESPFLFKASTVSSFGLDAEALRDSAHRPLLPGDQLRGMLWHTMQRLSGVGAVAAEEVAALFGTRSKPIADPDASVYEREKFLPARGRLDLPDLIADLPDTGAGEGRGAGRGEGRGASTSPPPAIRVAIDDKAPAFQPDWKGADYEAVKAALGYDDAWPEEEIRTRTAIKPGAFTADDSRLFSTVLIRPDYAGPPPNGAGADGTPGREPERRPLLWIADIARGAADADDGGEAGPRARSRRRRPVRGPRERPRRGGDGGTAGVLLALLCSKAGRGA